MTGISISLSATTLIFSSPGTFIAATSRKAGIRIVTRSNYKGTASVLYHNNRDGTFTDVSQKAGVANPEDKALEL